MSLYRKNQVYKDLSDSEFRKEIPKIWLGLSEQQRSQYEMEFEQEMKEYGKLMEQYEREMEEIKKEKLEVKEKKE